MAGDSVWVRRVRFLSGGPGEERLGRVGDFGRGRAGKLGLRVPIAAFARTGERVAVFGLAVIVVLGLAVLLLGGPGLECCN